MNKYYDKKLIWIPTLVIIVLLSAFVNADICTSEIEPNKECQMVTPVLSCTSYTYELFYNNQTLIESDSLTTWDDNVYYFNFSEGVGEYLIKLCDDTTREVVVKVSEEKMIAITWGFIIMAIYFVAMAFIVKNVFVKFGSFVFAFLELLMMLMFHMGSYQGGNLLPVLNVSFYIMLFIGFGLFVWKWIENVILIIAGNKTQVKEKDGFDDKW